MRFNRSTVDTNTLIARIQKRKAGTNELALQQAAGFLKEEILEALRNGEAVNIMDIGTLFIAATGKFNGTKLEDSKKKLLSVRFTPSQLAQSSVDSIEIKSITIAETGAVITLVTDTFTGSENESISPGKLVNISGNHLKVAGEGSGVFFCPVKSDGTAESDESEWIPSPKITSTTAKNLEFYAPENLESGKSYIILIRSRFSKGNTMLKELREAVSKILVAV